MNELADYGLWQLVIINSVINFFICNIRGYARNVTYTVDSKARIESEPVVAGKDTDELAAILNSMDGKGTGTARFIIDRKLP